MISPHSGHIPAPGRPGFTPNGKANATYGGLTPLQLIDEVVRPAMLKQEVEPWPTERMLYAERIYSVYNR